MNFKWEIKIFKSTAGLCVIIFLGACTPRGFESSAGFGLPEANNTLANESETLVFEENDPIVPELVLENIVTDDIVPDLVLENIVIDDIAPERERPAPDKKEVVKDLKEIPLNVVEMNPGIIQKRMEENPACKTIGMKGIHDPALQEQRTRILDSVEQFIFNGFMENVGAKNVDSAIFNGVSSNLLGENIGEALINGSHKNVALNNVGYLKTVNGVYKNLCVLAEKIQAINGSMANGGMVALVSTSKGPKSQIRVINGVNRGKLLVSGFDVQIINGQYEELILDGGNVERLNGSFGIIRLVNGATIGQ